MSEVFPAKNPYVMENHCDAKHSKIDRIYKFKSHLFDNYLMYLQFLIIVLEKTAEILSLSLSICFWIIFHRRTSCSACLNISECAWCENLRTCLPFSDYVSRHRHGQCTEWIDSEVTNSNNPYTCRNCTSINSCAMCLKTFSCGWCGNRINPTIGVCYEGDFHGKLNLFNLLN
jgi:hypothetical protein